MTLTEWCDSQFLSKDQRDRFADYIIKMGHSSDAIYVENVWAQLFVEYVTTYWHKKEKK